MSERAVRDSKRVKPAREESSQVMTHTGAGDTVHEGVLVSIGNK